MILGADVSGWQGPVLDYSGLDFVYVKITQGTYISNPNHDAQVAHARELGLIVGHYHFPAWGDPAAEARAFWSAAGAQPGDFLVLDIENSIYTPWPADPVSWCCAFEDELYRLSGTWAMDYAGPNVRSGWDWTALAQRGGGLIDPEYNPVGPGSPAPWQAVAMWQNADTNISGGDSDVFYGDRAALLRYGIGGSINTDSTNTPTGETPVTSEQMDELIARLMTHPVTQPDGVVTNLQSMISEYRSHVIATIDEIDKTPDSILNKPVPNAVGGQTSLGAMVGWNDAHVNAIVAAVTKVTGSDPAVITKAVEDALAAGLKVTVSTK